MEELIGERRGLLDKGWKRRWLCGRARGSAFGAVEDGLDACSSGIVL